MIYEVINDFPRKEKIENFRIYCKEVNFLRRRNYERKSGTILKEIENNRERERKRVSRKEGAREQVGPPTPDAPSFPSHDSPTVNLRFSSSGA